MMTRVSAKAIEGFLRHSQMNVTLSGLDYKEACSIAPSDRALAGDLTFASNERYLKDTQSRIVICRRDSRPIEDKTLIMVDNPKLAFIRTVMRFFAPLPGPKIEHGKNCYIEEGVRIGVEGFGYVRDENEELVKFPHMAGVRIGDNVDILANSTVARGSLSDTVIGDGTKLDCLVHVAHGVKIGNNCIIAAHAFIGGSSELGDYTTVWANATIFDNVKVGHHAVIGAGAVVRRDVPPHTTVVGNPAKPISK